MEQAVIIDSIRTGLAKSYRGGFNNTRADDMTAHLIDTLLDRHPKVEPSMVEDVILGCGYPEGSQGTNVARTSAVLSRLPVSVGGTTVNRFCSSGLQTVAMAATQIQSGFSDCIILDVTLPSLTFSILRGTEGKSITWVLPFHHGC